MKGKKFREHWDIDGVVNKVKDGMKTFPLLEASRAVKKRSGKPKTSSDAETDIEAGNEVHSDIGDESQDPAQGAREDKIKVSVATHVKEAGC